MRYLLSIITTLSVCWVVGQTMPQAPIADPSVGSQNKAPLRTEFISYDIRQLAEKRNLDDLQYYIPLQGNWRVEYIDDYKGSDTTFARPEFSVARWAEIKVPSTVERYASFRSVAENLQAPQLPTKISGPFAAFQSEEVFTVIP